MTASDGLFSVLFVCTGNLVRSPIALESARSRWSALDPSIRFSSAGTYAIDGAIPPEMAITAADQIGVNVRNHRAQALTPEMVHSSDLILVAERSHRAEIASMVPASSKYVFTLVQFARIATALQASPYAIANPVEDREAALGFVSAVAQSRELSSIDGPDLDDIDDPFGRRQTDYDRAAARIDGAVNHLLSALRGSRRFVVNSSRIPG